MIIIKGLYLHNTKHFLFIYIKYKIKENVKKLLRCTILVLSTEKEFDANQLSIVDSAIHFHHFYLMI